MVTIAKNKDYYRKIAGENFRHCPNQDEIIKAKEQAKEHIE
jgi:hypothetical protein